MVLAAFGEVRGNFPALDAVLAAIDDAGIRTVVCTGNLAVGYPYPNEVIDLIERRNIASVQGVHDKLTAAIVRSGKKTLSRVDAETAHALQWTYDRLTSANIEVLRALPRTQRLTVDGVDVCVCSGAPEAVNDVIGPETPDAKFQRYREAARADIVIGGNSRTPFDRLVEDTLFVNPGSVGDDPRGGAYAIVSTESEPWSVEHCVVEYDRGAELPRV
jgi:predicted phosphodiesterase